MHVGILITNYQAWTLSSRAVAEVRRWSEDYIARIVIVDDASDAPPDMGTDKDILIHRNQENLGYVRSVNVGMKLLTEDVVVLLDCDAYPLMNLVPTILRHFLNEPKLGALGFSEISQENKTGIAGEYEPTLMQFLLGQRVGAWVARRGWFVGKRFVLHSCCMAVRRLAFDQVGGFDEAFDFLDADIDLSMRLQDAGWLLQIDETLRCYHQGSGSPQTTSHRVVRFHRNRWRLLRKHRRIKCIWGCRAILFLRHLGELIALLLLNWLIDGANKGVRGKIASRRELLQVARRDYI